MIPQFHYREFLPVEKIVQQKKVCGATISLVIPTYNEIRTIGPIVTAAKKDLMAAAPLLDEIVVVDGGSDDGTPRCAAECGAAVYAHTDIGDATVPPGKGTALWKSLRVTRGDIVVCVDGDIRDFDCRFIYGLCAPLLYDASISYVKAYYARPIVVDDIVLQNYGGRVTELLVRPLLSTFYPDLARLFQPLSGEYGFRRSMIQHMPFSSGYGLELGLILNIYRALGISAFAQVDMDSRCHRNRSVAELGKMAHAILHVLLNELVKDNKAVFPREYNRSMIARCGGQWEEASLDQVELPPPALQQGERQ